MIDSAEVVAGTWASRVSPGDLRDARRAALWVIERSLSTGESADRLRERVDRRFAPRDRALLHQLVAGVLRWVLRLDQILESVSGRSIAQIDSRLIGPLRLGAFQLLFLDRVPAHAAVNASVEQAKERSRSGGGFVNAVLRKLTAIESIEDLPVDAGDPIEQLAVESSHPRFLVERWWRFHGEARTRRVVAANNRDRPAALLAVGGEEARPALIEALASEGVVTRPSVLSPVGLVVEDGKPLAGRAFAAGALYPQDEASQCAALIPLPARGERVLDAAAAPGGKTLTLLAWEPGIEVVAADRSVERLQLLLANRRRSRRSFRVVASDAIGPGLTGRFDRVVADLPCTGTGTLRKHPELKWRIRPAEIERLVRRGAAMLDGLAPLVTNGGLLIVSTCSIEPEENETQVAAFVARHPEFEPLDLSDRVHPAMASGIEAPGRWRLFPGGDHDGFTVHVLGRRRQAR